MPAYRGKSLKKIGLLATSRFVVFSGFVIIPKSAASPSAVLVPITHSMRQSTDHAQPFWRTDAITAGAPCAAILGEETLFRSLVIGCNQSNAPASLRLLAVFHPAHCVTRSRDSMPTSGNCEEQNCSGRLAAAAYGSLSLNPCQPEMAGIVTCISRQIVSLFLNESYQLFGFVGHSQPISLTYSDYISQIEQLLTWRNTLVNPSVLPTFPLTWPKL